jgi:hypothetical protein
LDAEVKKRVEGRKELQFNHISAIIEISPSLILSS